jgi:uncharacterized protein involved in cysteine biosynthesis
MTAMRDVFVAFGRALRSLTRRGIFWHLLWPGVLSAMVWVTVGVLAWTPLTTGLMAWIESWAWVGGWLSASEVAAAVVLVLVKISVVLAFVPLIYVTAALLVATIALPLMLERVGNRDYADLEQRHGGSNVGSAWNATLASLQFLGGLLLSLPFWLIPGVGLVAPVLLTGWLNQRAFGYDALMLHADKEELQRLREEQRMPMMVLGGSCAMLAYVPFVNLLAPAFSGLAFVHFLLETLRRERAARGVSIVDAVRPALPRTAA